MFGTNHSPKKTGQEILQEIEAPAPPPRARVFLQKHWKLLAAALCIAVAAAAALLPRPGAASAQAGQTYQTETPKKRSIVNTFSDSGTLSAANTYTVQPLVKGTVLTADFEVGDEIQAGQVLYTISASSAEASLESAQLSLEQAQANYQEAQNAKALQAEFSGRLCELAVRVGDAVTAGQQLAVLRDDSQLLLELYFPAAEAAEFSVGQTAQVTLNGTFETLSATVQTVSAPVSQGSLQVCAVTLAVPNPGTLTSSQAATAAINGSAALGSACFAYCREQPVTASASGTVEALPVQQGAWVSAGTTVMQLGGTALDKQLTSAQISLRNAELSLENAQEQLDNYTITSPISGTVIQKLAKAGDTVGSSSSGSETLCVIYDLSYLEMTLQVDELEILSIQEGQTAQITADALSEQTFEGVVTSVSAAGTTTSGTTTYPVTLRIQDTGSLLPGMNATAEIQIESAADALSVPSAAVVRGSYVLVTTDSPSASNADNSMIAPEGYVYVPVQTGVSDDDYIQITDGLTEADTVAYDPTLASKDAEEEQRQQRMPSGGMPGGQGGPAGRPGGGF